MFLKIVVLAKIEENGNFSYHPNTAQLPNVGSPMLRKRFLKVFFYVMDEKDYLKLKSLSKFVHEYDFYLKLD